MALSNLYIYRPYTLSFLLKAPEELNNKRAFEEI